MWLFGTDMIRHIPYEKRQEVVRCKSICIRRDENDGRIIRTFTRLTPIEPRMDVMYVVVLSPVEVYMIQTPINLHTM